MSWKWSHPETWTGLGENLRLMTLIDEFTRECLAIRVARRINSFGVLETMADVMLSRPHLASGFQEIQNVFFIREKFGASRGGGKGGGGKGVGNAKVKEDL